MNDRQVKVLKYIFNKKYRDEINMYYKEGIKIMKEDEEMGEYRAKEYMKWLKSLGKYGVSTEKDGFEYIINEAGCKIYVYFINKEGVKDEMEHDGDYKEIFNKWGISGFSR